MPLIDVRCTNDHESEVVRPLAMYPATPPCPICGADTTQYHPQPHTRWTPDPVVVFRAPDGSFRFPGDVNGTSAGRYAAQGYERIELRGAADVRRFESQMNKREYDRAARRVERMNQIQEFQTSQRRSEIRRGMEQGFQIPELDREGKRTGRLQTVRLSRFGRDVMRRAMDRTDARPTRTATDAGFHVEAYAYDHGNRDESRDAQGRRRRD